MDKDHCLPLCLAWLFFLVFFLSIFSIINLSDRLKILITFEHRICLARLVGIIFSSSIILSPASKTIEHSLLKLICFFTVKADSLIACSGVKRIIITYLDSPHYYWEVIFTLLILFIKYTFRTLAKDVFSTYYHHSLHCKSPPFKIIKN